MLASATFGILDRTREVLRPLMGAIPTLESNPLACTVVRLRQVRWRRTPRGVTCWLPSDTPDPNSAAQSLPGAGRASKAAFAACRI